MFEAMQARKVIKAPDLLQSNSQQYKFKVKYVATTTLNDKPVRVIRQEGSQVRMYTEDQQLGDWIKTTLVGKDVVATAKFIKDILWLQSIKEA